ncbi:MAG: DUF4287 domain-containing protein [Anaerolineales bacterium]|nr:MAG: DUF4287 domain-containing protein [Anaerolineales bacterium]
MSNFDKVVQSELTAIQTMLGMSLEELADLVRRTGLAKHNEIRWMLQREYGINHEDAKILVKALFESQIQSAA